MALLGAHMSIAGGYYKAVNQAQSCGCDCVQLFTKNNNQWNAKVLTDQDVTSFRSALSELKISHPIAHNSYLINLAAPDDQLWQKSIDAMIIELQRADRLGLPYVVAHPGSFTTSSEQEGISRIILALDEIADRTRSLQAITLLETTAGQGSNLGWRFEQLAEMLSLVKNSTRVDVCFDTCHVFAAGYPLATPAEYDATFREFDSLIGVQRIKAFHLNDSKRERGSRVDRHEHIGQGKLGLEPFRNLLNDDRFRNVPMYLETPKEQENGEAMDVVNLRTLRELIVPH